jgi:hypothetical protein
VAITLLQFFGKGIGELGGAVVSDASPRIAAASVHLPANVFFIPFRILNKNHQSGKTAPFI